MKKLIALALAAVLALSLTACATPNPAPEAAPTAAPEEASSPLPSAAPEEEADPTEVAVAGVDAEGARIEVTVPYQPERVVVLDLANLDILDNLGLGDCIVGAPTITLPYLQSYNDSLPIVGTVKTPDLEAVMACEPDLILMGGRMAEYYDELNEIAPTLRLTTVSDDGLVEAIRANAKTIGTIFGETEQVDALLAQYDARIAALAAFAEGKTCVLGMSTSGSSDESESSERGSGESGGHGSSGGSAEGSDSAGSTPTHGNEVSFEAIVALNPAYIFVMDRDSAIGTSGAQLASEIMENELIMKTDAYQNGNLVILENPGIWYLAEGGITSLGIMLEDLESALLQ